MGVKNRIKIYFALIILAAMTSCKAMDSSQTVYFEDRDMDFDSFHEQILEQNIYSYREAAAGGSKGKTGGGCGCN
ncbi:MAG: DUF4266 domain-containing protein [Bacteroidota bacterium]